MKIGFIGLGVMGSGMARNLMKNGFEVAGYARHPEKVQALAAEGLTLVDSIPQLAQESDVVITIVSEPKDVKEVYLGEMGLLANMKPGTIAVDMTTSDPQLAKELYALGKEKGIDVMDAPVTGGDLGAKNGTLTILAGGDEATFARLQPVFEAMGKDICYQGVAGNGQSAKLVNQILIAGAMAGVAEAFVYAQNLGMDTHVLYESLHNGAAASRSLDLYWQRMEKGDMNPGFFIRHFIKDMKLAQKEADQADLSLPVLNMVCDQYESLHEGELGTQALIHYYDEKQPR